MKIGSRHAQLARLARSRVSGLFSCALAFALVMLRLDAKSMWWDESLSLLRAQSDLVTLLSGRITFGGIVSVDQHPPLYFAALSGVRAMAGESDFALRLLSALASVLTVAICYALARRLLGGQVAALAALFVAASPLLLWYGQEARMYTLATLLALTALYAAWRTTAAWDWSWAFGALLATSAAAATHYLTVLFTVPTLLALAAWHRPRNVTRGGLKTNRTTGLRAAMTILGIVAISLGVADAMLRRLPSEAVYTHPALSLGAMLVDALNSYSLGLSVNLRHVWWIDLLFAGVWVLGSASLLLPLVGGQALVLSSARLRRLASLVMAMLAPILIVWLLTRWLPFYINSRYVMFSAPLFAIGIAHGLTASRRLALLRWAVGLGLLVGMGWSIYRYHLDPYYASKEDYAGAAQYVMARELPDDLLLINGPESQAAFEHYYDGRLAPQGLPNMTVRPWQLSAVLPEMLQGRSRVWVIGARRNFSDPDAYVVRWLDKHAIHVVLRTFESSGAMVSVSLYLVDDPVQVSDPKAPEPLALVGPAQLLGARLIAWEDSAEPLLDTDSPPPTVGARTGEAIAARLTWSLAEATPDLKVSLRLVRAGMVWAQRDARPIERLPSSVWPTGAQVTHILEMELPADLPPAPYELEVWAYDGETGASWPFESAGQPPSTHLLLATLLLEPSAGQASSWREPLAALMAPRWGRIGSTLQLTRVDELPEQVRPGQMLPLHVSWRWPSGSAAERQVVASWVQADGRPHASAAFPLLGPGPLSASASQLDAAQTRYPLVAPDEVGDYALHLLVYDPTRQRFLALRRGPLPGLGRDLELGQITVAP
jgi:4-amino-4-deoxy-L-arabinose transferase-like glycosyltransferase